jgi:hypothetical protein
MNEVIVEAENETGEPSDITDIGTETVEEGNLNVNPWPRLEELFTFSSQSSDKKNLLFKWELSIMPTIKKVIFDLQNVAFEPSKTSKGKG